MLLISLFLFSPLFTFQSMAQPDSEGEIAVVDLAKHLRMNYGVKKSVYLTQLAWQLQNSFSSSDQASSQWQLGLDTELEDFVRYPKVNSHALSGQFLTLFAYGMDLNKWRLTNLPIQQTLNQLDNELTAAESFSIYLNLAHYWQQLQDEFNTAEQEHWIYFPGLITSEKKPQTEVKDGLNAILQFGLKPDEKSLLDILHQLDMAEIQPDTLMTALLRMYENQRLGNYLAMVYDWLEIYQLMEFKVELISADNQQLFAQLIRHSQLYFETYFNEIDRLDTRFIPLLLRVFNALPEKFKNPDHLNDSLNKEILSLLTGINDVQAYFGHPIRKKLIENLEVCLNISDYQTLKPQQPIGKKQFIECVNDFVNWGVERAKESDLAGDLMKLGNVQAIARALDVPANQSINYLQMLADLDDDCLLEIRKKPNPIEWMLAAESLTWLRDRWPALVASYNLVDQINKLATQGRNLYQQPECFQQQNILEKQYKKLQSKWTKTKVEIQDFINEYGKNNLIENSDIDLFKPVDQYTQYIPTDMVVKPCESAKTCGAFVKLSPSFELLNLFPNHLRLAHQFELGALEICYDEVQWINRKTSPTHLDNSKMANFNGQLSIKLVGKYNKEIVFVKSISSSKEYRYLFAENAQEVLDLTCPLSIVGKKINTSLDRGTFGLFPNRLTFLTAARVDVNKILKQNWDQGDEWLTKLADENNSDLLKFDRKISVNTAVNEAFLSHTNELQLQIYRKLINVKYNRSNDSALSHAVFGYLVERKLLNAMVLSLYPDLYHHDPNIHQALFGKDKLMNEKDFRSAFNSQQNLLEMLNHNDQIIHQNKEIWANKTSNQIVQYLSSSINRLEQTADSNDQR
ncbi:MAG: hypothetical protein L3J52_03775 [Proteobacteria bacterium]|nr:hypothetical protein [Pseudomonadota bacterium]